MSDKKYYMHCAIGLILMLGFGFLPSPAPITHLGMQLLGIFFGLLYLWSTCGLVWPSVAGFIALAVIDVGNAESITKMTFGNSSVMMMIFITAVVLACQHAGVYEYLINWMMTRRFLNGNPWALSALFLLASYALSALSSTIPVIFMLWAMFYTICETVGLPKGSSYVNLMLIGIVFAACCGCGTFPFKDTAVIFIAAYTNMSGVTVPYLPYILTMVIVSVIALSLYLLAMRFIFKVDISLLKNITTDTFKRELPPMNGAQKFLALYSIFMIFIIASPALANFSTAGWTKSLSNLGMVGMTWVLFAILAFLHFDGKPVLDFNKLVKELPWELVFLVGAAMAVSSLLTGEGTGVKDFVAQLINPLFAGRSEFVFLALICAATLILTNVANNAVVAFMMMTMTYIFSTQFVFNQALAVSFINLTCNVAILLPASSLYGAMLYSNNEWIDSKRIPLISTTIIVIVLLVLLAVGIPLGTLLYQ